MSALVIDSSAIVAILQRELGHERLVTTALRYDVRHMSSATLLETAIVMFSRFGDAGEREVDTFVHRAGVQIVPVNHEHVDIARSAYRRFGKGRHAAGLNYGDCFSYALAISLGEPLLFTGNDFPLTDVDLPRTGAP